MEKLIELVESTVENDDYTKILNVIMAIFVLLAPSISIMFLYYRELFMNLDFSKLLLVCSVINIVFFSFIYFTVYLITKIEFDVISLNHVLIEYTGKKSVSYLDNKIKEYNKENRKKQISAKIKISSIGVCIFTIIVWCLFLWDFVHTRDVTTHNAIMKIITLLIIWLSVSGFGFLIFLYKYNNIKKERYLMITKKTCCAWSDGDNKLLCIISICCFLTIIYVPNLISQYFQCILK